MFLSRLRPKSDFWLKHHDELVELGTETESTGHKMIWFAFGDSPDRRRDFLWRFDEKKDFYTTLSRRPPEPGNGFILQSCMPYGDDFEAGHRMVFSMRVNCSVSMEEHEEGSRKRVQTDIFQKLARERGIVMKNLTADDLHPFKEDAARQWVESRSAKAGFSLRHLRLSQSGFTAIQRRTGADIRFSTADVEGQLDITDPDIFRSACLAGFGREKAFGCGMLVARRIPASAAPQ